MKKFNLYIAVPSTHLWEARFGMSLVFLTNYLAAHPLPGVKQMAYRVNNKTGSILPNMRDKMLKQALEIGATHLLFLDSDQTFPRDLVHRLMSRNKTVVAANIVTKSFVDCNPTARQLEAAPRKWGGKLLYTTAKDKHIEEVWRVGTGVMLIDLSIFKKYPLCAREHYFPVEWKSEVGDYTGEDWGFCSILSDAGVKLYIDHAVSWEVGHVGPHEFTHEFALMNKEIEDGPVHGGKAEPVLSAANNG